MQRDVYTEIWTDGSCKNNPGPGSWAYIVRVPGGDVERSGFAEHTTNNRMELTAVIRALRSRPIGDHVTVMSDSRYVVDGAMIYMPSWIKRDFKCVKNDDLWRLLIPELQKRNVNLVWVRGHADNEMNNRVDRLAQDTVAQNIVNMF
jgi:ribonuclease HI